VSAAMRSAMVALAVATAGCGAISFDVDQAVPEQQVNGSPLALTNSTLLSSLTAGIRILSATPTLTNITYKNNAIAASMDLASNPIISGVRFAPGGVLNSSVIASTRSTSNPVPIT